MVGHKILIVASLVLFAAGVAAAQSMLAGPSPGIAVNNGSVVAQSAPSTTTTTGTTTGPSTGTPGTTGAAAADTGTTTTGTTGTTGTTTTTTPTAVPGTTTNAVTINQIVSISRAVPEGTPVNAFTVPAGQQLVITDVIVTNPGTTASCGASVSPSGTTTTTTTTGTTTTTTAAATTTGTTETGTGVLCVPAQTSLNLGLTTGLEFSPGQNVVLGNAATAGGVATATALQFLLRGFLISSTGA